MMTSSRGSLSAFVVSITLGCISLVAFVHDSGRALSHYVSVADSAQNAARIGAQSISHIRDGNPRIDSANAISRAQNYLLQQGLQGQITTDHQSVTVRVRRIVPSTMLGSLGLHAQSISVTRSALVVGG
jgi:hypothetical protein